ncbi:membrane-bound alkaline phosphatase [Drosophila tropicalis]|uniref:membrane-bound alkaline phosphatase n=1 Tax=Drosophila tropicalis TaxID=46794 RepID=UPI0035ABED82
MSVLRLLVLSLSLVLLGQSVQGDEYHQRSNIPIEPHAVYYDYEGKAAYWQEQAQDTILAKLAAADAAHTKKAKNVILFLGDGMSVHTVVATRNHLGDSAKQVYFEQFPTTGFAKTYCVDRQVADSACTSTAYLGGVKGNYGTIGVNANVPRYSCDEAFKSENQVDSIAKWAQDAGKSAGIVTTTHVTHASPAGAFAHTSDRYWENDAEVAAANCNPEETIDIARQLVDWPTGKGLKVILGGGKRNFLNTTVNDEVGHHGHRTDGRNLIQDWLADKKQQNASASYVWSRKGLSLVDLDNTDYLLGLFATSHLPYDGDRVRGHSELADPSLAELTEAAIKVLQRNENGFFLFVEGARIDMAHHSNYARRSLEDTAAFAEAVAKAREMTSDEDTLIVVTADHAHVLTVNGYPERNKDITGLTGNTGEDGRPYTILSYANGPGFYQSFSKAEGRNVLTTKTTENVNFRYSASIPLSTETHGGDDAPVYATGPYSQFFSGTYEQTNIPALMARAANIGPYADVEP